MAILTVKLQQQQAQLLVMKIVLLIIKLTLATCFGFIHSHLNVVSMYMYDNTQAY